MDVRVGVNVSVGGMSVWVAIAESVGVNGTAVSICGVRQPASNSISNVQVAINLGMGRLYKIVVMSLRAFVTSVSIRRFAALDQRLFAMTYKGFTPFFNRLRIK